MPRILSAEVQAVIDQYPGVQASVVIGLPDEDLGQRAHAIIESDKVLDMEALRAWLTARLVRYKIPRTFEFVNEKIRNEAGKTQRSAFRQARIRY